MTTGLREGTRRVGLARPDPHRGTPALIQVGTPWVAEQVDLSLLDFSELRRCTERRGDRVDADLDLVVPIATIGAGLPSPPFYRWDNRPRSRSIGGPTGGSSSASRRAASRCPDLGVGRPRHASTAMPFVSRAAGPDGGRPS